MHLMYLIYRTSMLSNTVQGIAYLLWQSCSCLRMLTCCCCPVSQDSIIQHIASQGKDQNSKSEVLFSTEQILLLHYCEVKNCKQNCCKLGTICIILTCLCFTPVPFLCILYLSGCTFRDIRQPIIIRSVNSTGHLACRVRHFLNAIFPQFSHLILMTTL